MSDLLPFILFTLSATFTPGPNNIMIMNSGLNFGIWKSMPHYFGISLGFPIMFLLVALGLGAIFVKYIWLKEILKILGILYTLYLAWQIVRSHTKPNQAKLAKPLSFLQAVLFQWVNPKAWLMAISTISIFTLSVNYFMNATIISLVYCIMCLVCVGIWLLFGTFLQKILTKDIHRVWFNIIMAIALVLSIGLIFID